MTAAQAPARLLRLFLREVEERLRAFDTDLRALEAPDPGEREAVLQRLFRGAHSLKGAAAAVDAHAVVAVCQDLEDLLAGLRDGAIEADAERIEALFAASAAIRSASAELEPAVATPVRAAASAERRTVEYTLRIDAARIDALLERSSDLLVEQRRLLELENDVNAAGDALERTLTRRPDDDVRAVRRTLERVATALRDDGRRTHKNATDVDAGIRAIRTLPFGSALDGLDRVVNDVAQATGKRVRLEVAGADVGVDRAVLERLRDPLVQLVRNAIDHGIEASEERQRLGKPPEGTIRLGARPKGLHFEVSVEDDGAGFDLDALRRRASERGIALDPGADVARAAFLPGVSTAPAVTRLSGRGVGLDVVRTEVEALGGTVNVASTAGAGTRFLFLLPLTLTSLRALLCTVAGQRFGIALTAIERVLRIGPGDVDRTGARPMLQAGAEPVPLVSLRAVLGLDPAAGPGDERIAIVLRNRNVPVALAVDALFDERQIELRPLGPRLHGLRHIAGAAHAPDGSLELILRSSTVIEAALAPPNARRVLVVDDSGTARTFARDLLERAGFIVTTAADGRAAWERLHVEPVDVVISDVDMPEMDGLTLLGAIRSAPRFARLRVILITARESDDDRHRGIAAGADAYLFKSRTQGAELLAALGASA